MLRVVFLLLLGANFSLANMIPKGTLRADTAEAALIIETDTPTTIANLLRDTLATMSTMTMAKPVPRTWQYEKTEFIGNAIVNNELAKYEIEIKDQIRQLNTLGHILSQPQKTKRNLIVDTANALLGLFNAFQTHDTNKNLHQLQRNQIHVTKAVQHQQSIIVAHSKILQELKLEDSINYRTLAQTADYFKNLAKITTHTKTFIQLIHTLLNHKCHPEILSDNTPEAIQALQTKINSIGLHFAADPELQLVQNHADFSTYTDKIVIHVPIYVIQQGVKPLNLFEFKPTAHYHNGTRFSIKEQANYLAISENEKYYTEITPETWATCINMGPTTSLCNLPLRPTFNATTCLINIHLHNDSQYCDYDATPMDRTVGYSTHQATHIEFDQDTMITIKSNYTTEAFQIHKGTTTFKNDKPKEISWNKGRIYIAPNLKQTLSMYSRDKPSNFTPPNFNISTKLQDTFVSQQLSKIHPIHTRNSFMIASLTAGITLACTALLAATAFCIVRKKSLKILTGLNQKEQDQDEKAITLVQQIQDLQNRLESTTFTIQALEEKVIQLQQQLA